MDIPLIYPKIPDSSKFAPNKCYVFEKLDGTNIHWCWDFNKGFYAFGTRRSQYPLTDDGIEEFSQFHPEISEATLIFNNLPKIQIQANNAIIFTEFLGKKSFAGKHQKDDQKYLYIIDCMIDGNFLFPEEYLSHFKGLPTPKLLYKGKYTGQLVEDIRRGKFNVNEGVVIKGVHKNKLYMAKVKTDSYLNKLKENIDNWEDFWE